MGEGSRKRDREQARKYSAAYHKANREEVLLKMRERSKRYYQQNRERLIARAVEYQRENSTARNAYKSQWNTAKKINDPQFAAISIMRKLISRTCERIKGGRKEIARTVEALGYTTEQFRDHIERQFQDGMTWANHGQWHVDHIRPVSSFDLADPQERKFCNALENLRPLWAVDNMRKGAKVLAKTASNSD